MRVAVVVPPWIPIPPPHYGGLELVVDALCRGLASLGDEVLLCATADSRCPVELAACTQTAVGTDAIDPAIELRHVGAAYDAIGRWGADIVHDHTLAGPSVAGRLDGVPVVATNHGPFEGDLAATFARAARHAAVVAISHDHARRAGSIPIAAVIHHGLDVAPVPVGDGGGGYALFLGRMSPDKGVTKAIDVARRAGIPLKIAAKMREPAERRFFTEVVEPKLGPGIEYIGEAGQAEKLRLLQGAVALLNPIDWPEPFGLVMIESLACGTPVVATPFGSVPELIDDGVTGRLATDVDDLADGLAAAAHLDRRRCRAVAERRFCHARMAADHHRFFERIVEGRGEPSDSAERHDVIGTSFGVVLMTTTDGARLAVRGDVDLATAPIVADALRDAVRGRGREVTVDLSAVGFIDAAGAAVLAAAADELRSSARRMILAQPSLAVAKVLALCEVSTARNVEVLAGRELQPR